MTDRGTAVPIIVAIIGIKGTRIIVPAFNTNIFSPQLNNKANLHVDTLA